MLSRCLLIAVFQFTRPRGARRLPILFCGVQFSFNSRAHGGRDTRPSPTSMWAWFQFTRPRGARPLRGPSLPRWRKFQFTRPRGARQRAVRLPHVLLEVSIHAPTGGATACRTAGLPRVICFNSRAHGGRDKPRAGGGDSLVVSIHAPTGGATAAPSRKSRRASSFQFTRPRGARHPASHRCCGCCRVSIHAPTGGATRGVAGLLPREHRFNSRAHGGRDGTVNLN